MLKKIYVFFCFCFCSFVCFLCESDLIILKYKTWLVSKKGGVSTVCFFVHNMDLEKLDNK